MKKLNLYLFPIVLILFGGENALAQQEPIFTQLDNTIHFFNPASSGLNYRIQSTALARYQWSGVNGAPNAQFVNYSMKLQPLHGGIGINYLHETIAFSEYNRVKLNYAYHLVEFQGGQLSIGLSAGINNLKITPNWTPPTTVIDPTLPTGSNDTRFTSDLGLMYKNDRLSVGLSVTQLNQARYSFGYRDALHVNFYGDYLFKMSTAWKLKPQMIVTSDLVKISALLNFITTFKDKYHFGAGFRPTESVNIMAGWDIFESYRIRYSYDLGISSINSSSSGSHEICVGFLLK